jgi:hypothetical protein
VLVELRADSNAEPAAWAVNRHLQAFERLAGKSVNRL